MTTARANAKFTNNPHVILLSLRELLRSVALDIATSAWTIAKEGEPAIAILEADRV